MPHSTCYAPGVPTSVLRGSSITLALPWLLGIYHWAWRQDSKENFADRLSLELWRLPEGGGGWVGGAAMGTPAPGGQCEGPEQHSMAPMANVCDRSRVCLSTCASPWSQCCRPPPVMHTPFSRLARPPTAGPLTSEPQLLCRLPTHPNASPPSCKAQRHVFSWRRANTDSREESSRHKMQSVPCSALRLGLNLLRGR